MSIAWSAEINTEKEEKAAKNKLTQAIGDYEYALVGDQPYSLKRTICNKGKENEYSYRTLRDITKVPSNVPIDDPE